MLRPDPNDMIRRIIILLSVVTLLIPFISKQAAASELEGVVFSGKMELIDGKVTNGKVIYAVSWKKDVKQTDVRVNQDGTFKIKLPHADEYRVIFAHPDYEPVSLTIQFCEKKEYSLNVTMDRYKKSQSYKVISELNKFSQRLGLIEMKKEGGIFKAIIENIPEKNKTLKYQVLTQYVRSFNGNKYIDEHDPSGDFFSEVKVKHGKAIITFDDSKLRPGGSKASMKNIKWLALEVLKQDFMREVFKLWPIFKKKEKNKSDEEKLTHLYNTCKKTLESFSNPEDRHAYVAFINMYFSRFTKKFEKDMEDVVKYAISNKRFAASNTALMYAVANKLVENKLKTATSEEEKNKIRSQACIHFFKSLLENKLLPARRINVMSSIARSYKYSLKDNDNFKVWAHKIMKEFPGSWSAESLKKELKQIAMIGKPAPAFEYENRDGNMIKLSDLRGKFVLLDIWSTWCGPCIGEIPNMIESYEKIDKNKIEFVSVCIDIDKEKLKKYTTEKGMKWTQLFSKGNFKSDVVKKYRVTGIPCLFLIDNEGKIVVINIGLRGKELIPTINKYIKTQKD